MGKEGRKQKGFNNFNTELYTSPKKCGINRASGITTYD